MRSADCVRARAWDRPGGGQISYILCVRGARFMRRAVVRQWIILYIGVFYRRAGTFRRLSTVGEPLAQDGASNRRCISGTMNAEHAAHDSFMKTMPIHYTHTTFFFSCTYDTHRLKKAQPRSFGMSLSQLRGMESYNWLLTVLFQQPELSMMHCRCFFCCCWLLIQAAAR